MDKPAGGQGHGQSRGRPCGKCGGTGRVTTEAKGVRTSAVCGACKGSGSAGYLTK